MSLSPSRIWLPNCNIKLVVNTSLLGFLEFSSDEGVLRLISPVNEAPKALKLGSVRLKEGFRVRRVDLRNLFGTD